MDDGFGNPHDLSGAAWAAIGVGALVYLAIIAVTILAYVKIAHRAGYSGWWILLLVVPIANIVVVLLFAFKEWPVQREVRWLRAQLQGGTTGQLPPGASPGRIEG